jgi:hypothetical protein
MSYLQREGLKVLTPFNPTIGGEKEQRLSLRSNLQYKYYVSVIAFPFTFNQSTKHFVSATPFYAIATPPSSSQELHKTPQ